MSDMTREKQFVMVDVSGRMQPCFAACLRQCGAISLQLRGVAAVARRRSRIQDGGRGTIQCTSAHGAITHPTAIGSRRSIGLPSRA